MTIYFSHRELDPDEMQDVSENACDFEASGVFGSDGTLIAVCNEEVARQIADLMNEHPPMIPVGRDAWVWA